MDGEGTGLEYLASGVADPLQLWANAARVGSAPQLLPWDELLAEHRLAELALDAMEVETKRLFQREVLNTGFWSTAVRIIDQFVHRNHREKEERFLFPALQGIGEPPDRAAVADFQTQHTHAHDLTHDIVEGIREGDWERVLRASSMYVSGIRKHMAAEEDRLGHIASRKLSPWLARSVCEGFAEVEAEAFDGRSRHDFLRDVLAMCEHTGVEVPIEMPADPSV